ncbi:hypothetical protein FA13DRAFT_605244 [Coprinellus micaceus]|uniref:Uncharacterized protein n=1 Tax=Coprinellus micaceus TaxID=71717 RepID=A0A4Y7T8S9_COPMI|nr:hypothetical protein FA13DRAFT_605244 [Coprinellus micaceus]
MKRLEELHHPHRIIQHGFLIPFPRPPHMVEPRREPAADYRSGPSRRERGRSPSPPPRVEIRPPPPEPRRQLNGDAERYREPNSPNLSRNVSSSTLAGSGNSWTSELDRRPSRPGSTTMDVDPKPDRYPPPSDKFREALRVSSNGHDSRRDNNGPPPPNRLAHPILPIPPANLPSNPMLAGRDQRAVDPPERSPVTTRWSDRPSLPHIKPNAPLPLVAPRPPLSPTTSKKILSETEVSPPRLRRPSASVVADRKAQDEAAARERERDRGQDRERMERDRDWDREREKDRSERDRGLYDRPPNRSQPPPAFVARTSLLDRLEAPSHASSANSIPVGNGAPSLFDRMSAPSGTVPMKRNSEQMFGGGGRMDTDDLYGPVEESSDVAKKRRRNAGARQRRGGGKRN